MIWKNKPVRLRILEGQALKGVVILFSALATVPVFLILGYVGWKGASSLSWSLFASLPVDIGESGGGVVHALVGTGLLVVIGGLIATVIGVLCGIYLSEHLNSRWGQFVRMVLGVLQGLPSIIVGMVVYLWIVVPMHSFSMLAGAVAVAIIMLPLVTQSTEETIKLVPYDLREASLALGVHYRTLLKVIIPCAMTGIVSGIMLGVVRIVGETAPLLLTAFGSSFLNLNPLKPVSALPLLIYNYTMSPYDEWHKLAWAMSLILIVAVLISNLLTQWMTKKWNIRL